jgi:hypothetical protein
MFRARPGSSGRTTPTPAPRHITCTTGSCGLPAFPTASRRRRPVPAGGELGRSPFALASDAFCHCLGHDERRRRRHLLRDDGNWRARSPEHQEPARGGSADSRGNLPPQAVNQREICYDAAALDRNWSSRTPGAVTPITRRAPLDSEGSLAPIPARLLD